MKQAEFDKFADEYLATHATNIRVSGETPAFFAEYKIKDIAKALAGTGRVESILDFGGGIGTSVPHVRRYFPDATLTCLDVSDRSIEIARERHGDEARFVTFDGAQVPFGRESFDLAFAACVFHHIKEVSHSAALAELVRILRPGGHLFVFEHNPFNPLTRHTISTCPFDENAILIAGRRMRRTLEKAGFCDVHLRYRMFFPRLLSLLRCLEPHLAWLPMGAQYYVSGRKQGSL